MPKTRNNPWKRRLRLRGYPPGNANPGPRWHQETSHHGAFTSWIFRSEPLNPPSCSTPPQTCAPWPTCTRLRISDGGVGTEDRNLILSAVCWRHLHSLHAASCPAQHIPLDVPSPLLPCRHPPPGAHPSPRPPPPQSAEEFWEQEFAIKWGPLNEPSARPPRWLGPEEALRGPVRHGPRSRSPRRPSRFEVEVAGAGRRRGMQWVPRGSGQDLWGPYRCLGGALAPHRHSLLGRRSSALGTWLMSRRLRGV